MLLLLLLRSQHQQNLPYTNWERITERRSAIARALRESPSLWGQLEDSDWLQAIWEEAAAYAASDTGLEFPDALPWDIRRQVLAQEWLPQWESRGSRHW